MTDSPVQLTLWKKLWLLPRLYGVSSAWNIRYHRLRTFQPLTLEKQFNTKGIKLWEKLKVLKTHNRMFYFIYLGDWYRFSCTDGDAGGLRSGVSVGCCSVSINIIVQVGCVLLLLLLLYLYYYYCYSIIIIIIIIISSLLSLLCQYCFHSKIK